MADPHEQHDGTSTPPEKKPPAKAVKKTAKPAAKKQPAKKAPAKKPALKPPLDTDQRIKTNGEIAAAAKDAAAQAKSTVERANNPVSPDVAATRPGNSPAPLLVALMLSLLSILLIRQIRRPR